MTDILVELICAKVRFAGAEPYSWKFFFDERYAELRNTLIPFDGSVQTVLSVLISQLTKEQRLGIFPMPLDLGNDLRDEIRYSESDLIRDLSAEFLADDRNPLKPSTVFTYIDPWLKSVTGASCREHISSSPLKALKVIKLLYRTMKRRRSSILRLLRAPGGKVSPSLELRDRFPLSGNETQVWLLADLVSYLGMEMEPVRARRIKAAFDAVIPRIAGAANYIGRHVTMNEVADAREDVATKMVNSLLAHMRVKGDVGDLQAVPLDEQIYFYLQSLSFLNYVGEHLQIVELTTPTEQLHAIPLHIEKLRDAVARGGGSNYSGGPVAPSTDSAAVYARWKADLLPLISHAVGRSMTDEQFEQLIPPAQELLYRYHMFKWPGTDPAAYPLGIFEFLTAACAIWHEMNSKTSYRPYWFGQKCQGNRLLPTLDTLISQRLSNGSETIPEALNQIWVGRYRWVADSVKGEANHNRLRSLISVRLLEAVGAVAELGVLEQFERSIPPAPPMVRARVALIQSG